MLARKIQKELETLPERTLQEVEDFIKTLKIKKSLKKKAYNVFDAIESSAIETDIKDWARHHDHYLYGIDKR